MRKLWWDYLPGDPVTPPPLTVYPSEARRTGLLDPDGNAIWKYPEPLGFLTREVLDAAPVPSWHCRIGRIRFK
jgi:hypothetical protein